MRRFIRLSGWLLACIVCLVMTLRLAAQTAPIEIPEVDEKIKIDGVLDDAGWQHAAKMELKYEITPGENIAPPVRTELFLAYGKSQLYIAFYAYDPDPASIRARLTDRDNVLDDDWVSVSLDTFNDQRRVYTFVCNPIGIQSELIETNTTQNMNWDTIWASSGRVVQDGYVVEIAIPFSSLRFQRKKEAQVWGFNAERRYPRNLDHYIDFMPRDRNNFCIICQMAKIVGFQGARPGRNLEIDPSVSGMFTQERNIVSGGDWQEKEKKIDPGVTMHWGFSPNMTLSAAVNPDFSQVEADAAQLDLNLQYALYYPEKRPFFLEGSSIFDTRLAAIYTRTLADPDWGVKLTGKEGSHAIGFYSAQDHMTNLIFPGPYWSQSTSLDMNTIGSVLRYRLDVGKISTLGVIVTDREGDNYFNRLAGADAYFRLSGKKHLSVQFLASQTRYPGDIALDFGQSEEKFDGTALDVNFRHESRNIGYYAWYQQVEPDFRADLGFMPQVGYRNATAGFILAAWHNPGHWYTFLNAQPRYEYEVDYDGNLIYKRFTLTCNYRGPAQSALALMGQLGKQSFLGQIFDTNSLTFASQIQPSGQFMLWFNGIFGDQVDFSNVRAGKRLMLNPGINFKAGQHFSVNLDHVYEKLDVDVGRLYIANVTNLRLIYQFSKRAFLRTILQYVDYRFTSENYLFPIDPEYKNLFSQVLFSYKINPQTMLFIGYSDDYYGYSIIPLTQSNRTIFLKIGYALML